LSERKIYVVQLNQVRKWRDDTFL